MPCAAPATWHRPWCSNRGRELAGCEILRDGILGFEIRYSFQFGSEWSGTELVDGRFIHAGGVVVADLLLDRGVVEVGLGGFFEDGAQLREIFVLQLTV